MRVVLTAPRNGLGTNIDNALEKIEEAITQATAADTLTYTAKANIKSEWTPNAEQLQKDIAEQLHNEDIKLNPNFEGVGAVLKGHKDVRDDWEKNLGYFMKSYFGSLLSYLKYNKFKEDDMMYEGFAEVVDKNEVKFRIVDKLTGSSSYNQCLVEEGVLILQTTPANFGTNIDYTCEKIVDLL